jgi:hypothetical protein
MLLLVPTDLQPLMRNQFESLSRIEAEFAAFGAVFTDKGFGNSIDN